MIVFVLGVEGWVMGLIVSSAARLYDETLASTGGCCVHPPLTHTHTVPVYMNLELTFSCLHGHARGLSDGSGGAAACTKRTVSCGH